MIPEPVPVGHALPEEGESWLFISYSRTTSDLANALTEALEARGYRVWIDQESITPASDWRARISVGIEGARAVVLILSERFITSPNCDRELVEAAGLGKRLIPVLAEDIAIERLPAPVPDLDLIMAPGADLDGVIAEVVEAVETDLEWLDEHTRLLQSALRWAETPEDRSLLLRGNDLRAMLGRVAEAGERPPTVTLVQRSFLTACEANKRRVRNLSWAAALATAAILGLAVIATVQRAAAVEARTGAEAQRIATEAESLYDTQLDLGLRLALIAHTHAAGPATESALLRGLTFGPGLRAVTQVAPGVLDEAVFADTGRSILLLDGNGGASSWSETGEVVDLADGVVRVASHTDGVITVGADTVSLPGGASCPSGGRVLAVEGAPWGAVISLPDGDGSRVLALEDDCTRRVLATTEARVSTFAGAPSGLIAWGTQRGQVTVVDRSGAVTDDARFDGAGVTALAFGPNGDLAVGLDNGSVTLLDGVDIDRAHRGAVTAITFATEGLVSAGADGWIRLWDPRTGRLGVELTDIGPNGQTIAILDVTQWVEGGVVSIDRSGRAQGWDLVGRSPLVTRIDATLGIDDLVVTEGGFVAMGAEPVSDAAGMIPDPEVTAVGPGPDGPVFGDATGGVWRRVDDGWVRRQGPSDLPVRLVAGGVWADEQAVYSEADRWEVPARALVNVDDEAYAATADGEVLRLTATGSEVAFGEHHGTVDALDVSPDGTLVASGGDDRLVYVWERGSGAVVRTFVGHTDRVLDLAFSPDGSLVATVGEDDRMIVWDLEANAMVGSPTAHPRSARIEAVAWQDDSVLLTGGPGVFRWTVGTDDVAAAACRLAGPRTLTSEEIAQYLGEVEEQDAC